MPPAFHSRLSACLRTVGLAAGFVVISLVFRHQAFDKQLPNQQDTFNYYRTVYQAVQAIHSHDYLPRLSTVDSGGMGYPFLQFYPPLSFLFPAYLSVLLNVDVQVATNVAIAIAYVVAGFAFICLGRRLGLPRWAAAVGAVSLLTFPFVTHLSLLNIPMFFGLCAGLCVLAGLAWCLQDPKPRSVAALYAAVVVLGLTHLLSVLLVIPALLVLAPVLASSREPTTGSILRQSGFGAAVVALGLATCAFQLGPALLFGHAGVLRMSNLLTDRAGMALFASHHTLLRDLFCPWIGGPTQIEGTQLSEHQFRLGLPFVIGLFAVVVGLLNGRRRGAAPLACVLLVLGAITLTMPAVLRHAPEAIGVFQFSSRFLEIIAVPGALLVGFAAAGLERAGSRWVAVGAIVATSALCVQHLVSADNSLLTGLTNPVRLADVLKDPRSTYSEEYLIDAARFPAEYPHETFLGNAQYPLYGDRGMAQGDASYPIPTLASVPPGARLVGRGRLPDGFVGPQLLDIRLGGRILGRVPIKARGFSFSLPIPVDLGRVDSIAYEGTNSIDIGGQPIVAQFDTIKIEGLQEDRTVAYWDETPMTVARSGRTTRVSVPGVADGRIYVAPVLAYPGLQSASVNGVSVQPILVPRHDRVFLGFRLPKGGKAVIVVTFTGQPACNALSWIGLVGALGLIAWTGYRPPNAGRVLAERPEVSGPIGLLSNEGFLLSTLFTCVAAFYGWTADSADFSSLADVRGMPFTHESPEYYPLLTKGFIHGQLSLYKTPSPQLLAIDDPWDPAKTGELRLPDATFYQGKFYLYFGPTPVFLLFLPCRLLTGLYPSHAFAVAYFSVLGLGINFLLLRSIRRRYFPRVTTGMFLCAALVLAFATTVPQLLRRPDVWEVAIASGYFTVSVALMATYFALTRRSGFWLAVASLGFGLAAGSRPTLIMGSLALIPVLRWLFKHRPSNETVASFLKGKFLPAALPCAVCVLGLLLYNALRFGSPFEFGQRYQMHAVDERGTEALAVRFIPFNARVYFLSPPNFSLDFPFVHTITVPKAPKGQLGFEEVYGLVPTFPVLLVGLVAFALAGAAWRRRAGDLAAFALATAIVAASGAAFILVFAGACNRYQVDFAPYLALLACIGLFVAAEDGRPALWLRGLAIAATAWSVFMGVVISLAHKDILQLREPDTWQAIARFGNAPLSAVDWLRGSQRGTVVLHLTFPDKSEGSEVLFKDGHGEETDTLFVDYFPHGRIRLRLDHMGFGGPETDIVPVGRAAHTLTLELGCLYATYDVQLQTATKGAPLDDVTMRFGVWLDGLALANRRAAYFPSAESDQHWGFMAPVSFSGEVTSAEWTDQRPSPERARAKGPVILDVEFPRGRAGAQDPLVATGAAGRADVVYVRYLDDRHVKFGCDHWGYGLSDWPAIEVTPGVVHRLIVRLGTATGAPNDHTLRIDLDGKRIVDADIPIYPVSPQDVYIGYTPYMDSSCGLEFSGVLREVSDPAVDPRGL